MKSQEIRERFLDFFEKKNHKIVKSSALLPKDDPSLLFTNAGMNQFKNVFLGLEKRSYKRAASVQKCMRVSGKHNDLEQVGKTNKHHTFFEMLGNFSFGDYFKKEACVYAWELVTETYRLDKDKLYVTVYEDDDEAFGIWKTELGISEGRIFRFGKKDNYWAMGETGPCGPCSEIHYDLGDQLDRGEPYSLIESGSDRFLELWNLVFMQYEQDGEGNLRPLPSPSIDTGMGLERMAAVLQGKQSNFETDLFYPLIEDVCDMARIEYPGEGRTDTSVRIIADHVRAATFLIGDGIMPSNDGRGYVLRRIIRRAFRNGNKIGLEDPFLYKVVGRVVDIMKDSYPELLSSAAYISDLCLSEERRFSQTLSSGLKTFHQFLRETKEQGQQAIPGTKVFKLYDTYGFPLDLSKELAEEENLTVDEEGFRGELQRQREQARESWKGGEQQREVKAYEPLKKLHVAYLGYGETKVSEAKVLAIMKNRIVCEELSEGEEGEVVLDKTPFYAEAGGQVGDRGILKNRHFSAVVETAFYPIPNIIIHKIRALSGKIRQGDTVDASIDEQRRRAISKNHTATHLLHASLRNVLGDHIRQAGSLVSPERLRFDFTHFAALSASEIHQIEALINEKIQENQDVRTSVVSLEEGLRSGATAIFEEKYGEEVRMVSIGDFSRELCGGVHVHRTGEIGLFVITSESSIASGMRRIEAVTGPEAVTYIQDNEDLLFEMQDSLQASKHELIQQLERLQEALKEKEKENRALRKKLANVRYKKEEAQTRMVKGIPVLAQKVEGVSNTEIRELADHLKQKIGSGIVVLGSVGEEKVFVVASVSKDLSQRFDAQDFIKEIGPMIGGGGGGRRDFAQAGGSKPDQLEQVLSKTYEILEDLIE